MSLKARIQEDVKAAMRAGDKARVGRLRTITAAIKQREVDSQRELDDSEVIEVLGKLVRQGREAEEQYREAGREELAERERADLEVLEGYLPEPLGEAELDAAVDAAIAETGAASKKDMGKVMGVLKPRLQGRADMSTVSARVKDRLQG